MVRIKEDIQSRVDSDKTPKSDHRADQSSSGGKISKFSQPQTGDQEDHKLKLKHLTRELQKTKKELSRALNELSNSDENLEENRGLLKTIFENSEGPVFSVDCQYCYTSFNREHADTMKRLYNANIEKGKNLLDYHTNRVDRANAKKNIDRALKGELVIVESFAGEENLSRRFFEITHYPIFIKNGRSCGVVIQARDVTEMKKKSAENQRINRTLKALSNSNQAMMRATDEMTYLKEVCKNIETDCGHALVWIGLAEDDEAKTVHVVASTGFEDSYLKTVNISWENTEKGRGPTGTAIRTGKVCECRNMLTDPNFQPWRAEAIKHGYASSIALPLIAAGKPFGAITIYSKEYDYFSVEEVKLLSELASDLAYGITVFRLRAIRAKAEEALKISEGHLRTANDLLETVTEGTGVIIATQDNDFHYTYFNKLYKEEIKRLTGKDIQIGSSMIDLFADLPEQQEIAVREWSQVLGGNPKSTLLEFGDPNRYRRIYNIRHTPIKDLNGRIVGAGEVAYEVTEQERLRIALAESEAHYQVLFNSMTEGFALHEIILDDNQLPVDFRFLDVNPAFEYLTGLKREDVVGKLLSQVHQPECGDPLKVAIYQNYPSKTDQSLFEGYSPALNKHFAVQFYTPEPGQFATILQDISERKRSEELQKWLASFPQLNPSPIIEMDINGTLHYINPAARKAFPDLQKRGFEHPFLIDIKEMFNLFQSSDSQMVTRDILVGDSYFRQTLSYISETKRVRAYSIDITTRIKAEEALLKARDQLEATVLLRTNELFKSNEQLQIELTERQRLADSLHDAVNQSLFSAGLIAEVLPRLWERDQVEARQSLLDLRQLTGGAQAELRALLTELRPSVISTNDLGYLFEQLTNAFSGRTNIPIELKISGNVAFTANVQVVFYRVCQEALNNISKHAQAKQVVVQFKNKAGILKLRIEDDGRGFNPDSPVPGHYGLSMMIERAESIGATIAIKSQPGKGTQVNLRWKEAQIEDFK